MKQTVNIERMAYSADAVGHLDDGKVVFVSGAAPGDTVQVEIDREEASFAHAHVLEVVAPSPVRVAPKSPIDAICGTAPWQHLTYEAQLEAKRGNIVDALDRTAHFAHERAEELVAPCIPCPRPWGYRNKLELACAVSKKGALEVGFYREGTHDLVPADASRLAHAAIQKSPRALRGALRFALGGQDVGIYRVGVRHSYATRELEIALWTRPGSFPRALVAKTLQDALKPTSIVRVLAEPGSARKIKGIETLAGRGFWSERIDKWAYSVAAPSFFQVNTEQASQLISQVLACAGDVDGSNVADLYSGAGTFSIPLAAAGADVVAVESTSSAVRDLRYNADANGVEVEVLGGDAARELRDLGDLDVLVVDPPRAGLAESVPADIAASNPERVIYVSCDPPTWARDVARLEKQGYKLERVQPVDMFPQMYHVELVSSLLKAKN